MVSLSIYLVMFVFMRVDCTKFDDHSVAYAQLRDDFLIDAIIDNLNGTVFRPNGLSDHLGGGSVNNGSCKEVSEGFRNVSKCATESIEHQAISKQLFKSMMTSLAPLDLTSTASTGVTNRCKQDFRKYQNDLFKLKLWALKMYDANAKLPSGLLSGNINQFGDFDLCLAAKSEEHNINGQYCFAYIDVEIPNDPHLAMIHKLVHAHYMIKSTINDPGHRVPRFTSLNWALCVPDSCTSQDVHLSLTESLNAALNSTGIRVKVKVDKSMCQTAKTNAIGYPMILGSLFFLGIAVFAIFATVHDYQTESDKSAFVMCFSLRKNLTAFLSVTRQSNDIEAAHGVRFLNAFVLLLSHKSMALFFVPYVNRTKMSENLGQAWTVLGRASSLYTDPFIMLSGMLTAYSLFGKLQKTNRISIREEYVARLFRILPTFVALIAFCTFVLPHLDSGPQWNLVVTHYADTCKQHGWRNLLFIHNYFGFKDMCLTHTHHIGIDTQLFFVSPFLVLLVWKWPKKGILILTVLATISTFLRFYVTYTQKLSNYIHFGTSIEQLFKTADNMYILPPHRFTVYAMGILLGYLLRNCKHITMTQRQLQIGNRIAILTCMIAFFGPAFMGNINYVYNPLHAAMYAAFSPILWCLSFAWVIFTAHLGHKGTVNRFFSWRGFLVFTRLSYALYLTQFPVFFFNVGKTRNAEYYGFFEKMFNVNEISWIIFVSLLLTLLIDFPFQNLRQLILPAPKKPETKRS